MVFILNSITVILRSIYYGLLLVAPLGWLPNWPRWAANGSPPFVAFYLTIRPLFFYFKLPLGYQPTAPWATKRSPWNINKTITVLAIKIFTNFLFRLIHFVTFNSKPFNLRFSWATIRIQPGPFWEPAQRGYYNSSPS